MDSAGRMIAPEDLRAAVASGVVTEAQAASITALADTRAGKRQALPAEDEPFEFFRGFSEIFVSLGLLIALAGIAAMTGIVGRGAGQVSLCVITAFIVWCGAEYFTLKRRMNLPSMVLAAAFGISIFAAASMVVDESGALPRYRAVAGFGLAALGMAIWYRRFRLPFSVFVLGVFALGAAYTGMSALEYPSVSAPVFGDEFYLGKAFNLRQNPHAWAILAFGIAAFTAAMWFDTRDPHRLGRASATAFWLHILAAPALVNPVALTLWNLGGTVGIVSLAAALVVIAALALVIDRRSFLTAALVYIALVIGWVTERQPEYITWPLILFGLGAFVTAVGTWWVPLRSALMRRLPSFPGKSRLPPYAENA
jgi:hypothetical protein